MKLTVPGGAPLLVVGFIRLVIHLDEHDWIGDGPRIEPEEIVVAGIHPGSIHGAPQEEPASGRQYCPDSRPEPPMLAHSHWPKNAFGKFPPVYVKITQTYIG